MNELEKKYLTAQRQVQNLVVSTSVLNEEKIRASIAYDHVKDLKDDHKCYKSLGRAFIVSPTPTLKENLTKNINYCSEEIIKNKKLQDGFMSKIKEIEIEAQKLVEEEKLKN